MLKHIIGMFALKRCASWVGDSRINIQDKKGKAKFYHVKHLLKTIDRLESEHDAIE
jgi:hypothetical protein